MTNISILARFIKLLNREPPIQKSQRINTYNCDTEMKSYQAADADDNNTISALTEPAIRMK